MEEIDFSRYGLMPAAQGWQCPICKRIYSPTTMMCPYCGNGRTTATSNTDWVHKESETLEKAIGDFYKREV